MLGLCKSNPRGKYHEYVKWRNEEHPNTGKTHGPSVHLVMHCKWCGKVKK